ncbi:hypothetical protein [Bdellovibrio svalbardensis]|uniref:Uncharacterized protein n=1 Tax=Bdellovibrio svalbardensis TaxID=2972972 RepID=A0ABT6DQR1_9BACT|nr:hypothetical protein [Bdellovibrio svalbardensis]MDG0818161.1 hypothetical protein [Bdellovibrio svalbardensis]
MKPKLPWWTWIVSFFVALAAKLLSFHFLYFDGFFYIYGSYVFCLPLYFMWGGRVFWGQLAAETVTANVVGFHEPWFILMHGAANTAKPLLGYYLFIVFKGESYKHKIDRSLIFFFWTLLIGSLIGNFVLLGLRVAAGDFATGEFLSRLLRQVLRDCLSGFFISYFLLDKLGPWLKNKKLSYWPPG